jgi:hypothetical protein
MLLLALFEQSLLLQSLTWVILWLEEEWGELALLLALFEQRLLLQSLTSVMLWVVLGKKPMAIAAGARLVPRNTPIAIAPIAITLICLIIVSYCILLYKRPLLRPTCGICHLLYIKLCKKLLKATNSIAFSIVYYM